MWTGEDALRLGLVDRLGGLADAIRLAKLEAELPTVSVLVLQECQTVHI